MRRLTDLKTVILLCEFLLSKGYVDAVKEVLGEVNRETITNASNDFEGFPTVKVTRA